MKHIESEIMVDVSFGRREGIEATEIINHYLVLFPEARYLIIIMKVYLKNRTMNDTYHGGVGSFLLQMLVFYFM